MEESRKKKVSVKTLCKTKNNFSSSGTMGSLGQRGKEKEVIIVEDVSAYTPKSLFLGDADC